MLILAFACSLCSTPAYAHGLRSDAEVTEGLELIESFMKIPRSYLTGTTVNQDGMVVFSYDIDGVASAITVTQESDGTTFEVSEGSTVASMKFTNNNELYLNNKTSELSVHRFSLWLSTRFIGLRRVLMVAPRIIQHITDMMSIVMFFLKMHYYP